VTEPSVTAVIEMVDVALICNFLTPAGEPKLPNPDEVQEGIRSLKVSKAPGPNSILRRALKNLPQQAVSLLAQVYNEILLTRRFLTVWKHVLVINMLKPGKDPPLPSFYRPINLFNTFGKLFERILLARILHDVSECGLMRNEKFRYRPRRSISLQLASPVERKTRDFGKMRLTGAVFLDVAKPSIPSGSKASCTSYRS
jgi:hypothetical protein